MDIKGPFKPNKKQGNIKQTSDVDGITLTHLGQSIDVDPKEIKEACAQAARQAYDLGETNDEESYREEMEEVLTEVLRQKSGKKK